MTQVMQMALAKEGPGEGSDPEAGAKSEAQGAGDRSAKEEPVEQ